MAIGDSDNILSRMKSVLPGGWFSRVTPIRDAMLGGVSDELATLYDQIGAANAQTRIATATGWFLDLIAWDFFGARFLRFANESDDAFRARIIKEILRERATAKGILSAVTDLTQRPASIWRPAHPGDNGGGYGITRYGYGRGKGSYGSISYPNQVFLTVYRPVVAGIPIIAGYGAKTGGYGKGRVAYATITDKKAVVTDADLYKAAADAAAAGVVVWTHIKS